MFEFLIGFFIGSFITYLLITHQVNDPPKEKDPADWWKN